MSRTDFSFRTKEVADFYDCIRQCCHPEFPFLDAHYSPGSYMPAVDMTFFVAQCISDNNYDAIKDLMSFVAPNSEISRTLIDTAMMKSVPDWIILSDAAREELQAIHLLLVRMACACLNYSEYSAGRAAATTLACRQLAVADGYNDTLLTYTKAEAKPLGADARTALEAAVSPLGASELCANKIKSVPPMARLVVEDYVSRDWGKGKLRPYLYYGERMYGCCAQDNLQYIELLGFFDQPTDATEPYSEITKEILRKTLEQHGLTIKKSASRREMIETAQTIPGLLSSLISTVTPECKALRPDYEESVRVWASRVRAVEPVALAILKAISIA